MLGSHWGQQILSTFRVIIAALADLFKFDRCLSRHFCPRSLLFSTLRQYHTCPLQFETWKKRNREKKWMNWSMCPHSPSSQLGPLNSSPLSAMLMLLRLPGCSVRLRGGRPGGCRVCAQHFSRISVWGHAGMGIFTLQSAPALLSHGSAWELNPDAAARPLADLMKQYIAAEKMWRRNREILFCCNCLSCRCVWYIKVSGIRSHTYTSAST